MELLFAVLGGAILGILFRYVVPGRETHGALLVPAVGAAVASIVFAMLTWAQWRFDGTWIWVASLVIAGLAALGTALLLPRRRRVADAALFASLARR